MPITIHIEPEGSYKLHDGASRSRWEIERKLTEMTPDKPGYWDWLELWEYLDLYGWPVCS